MDSLHRHPAEIAIRQTLSSLPATPPDSPSTRTHKNVLTSDHDLPTAANRRFTKVSLTSFGTDGTVDDDEQGLAYYIANQLDADSTTPPIVTQSLPLIKSDYITHNVSGDVATTGEGASTPELDVGSPTLGGQAPAIVMTSPSLASRAPFDTIPDNMSEMGDDVPALNGAHSQLKPGSHAPFPRRTGGARPTRGRTPKHLTQPSPQFPSRSSSYMAPTTFRYEAKTFHGDKVRSKIRMPMGAIILGSILDTARTKSLH